MIIKKYQFLFPFILLGFIFCIFFYKVLLFHEIPFPGDLLVASSPFKTQSYLGYAPAGYPNKAQGRDVISQLYPWKYLSIQNLKQGRIPFWNPYNFSGNVLMQNYQSGVFYPLNIFFFLFSFPIAWAILILIQPLLAMGFMYIFLRERRLSYFPSLIGAVAFAFSSYMVVWLEWGNIDNTLLWLPLILFCISRLFKKIEIRWYVVLTISVLSCLLAGYIQGAFYILVVAFLYAQYSYFQNISQHVRSFWIVTVGFICGLFIAAINVLPTLVVFNNSTRGAYSASQIHNLLNPWYYLVTLFSSDFFGNPATRNFFLPITYFERVMYVGVPILFFAFYALRKFKENSEARLFMIIGVVVLLLSLNFPGVSLFYHIPLPTITTTVPTRILSIFAFCFIILAAFGINDWINEKKSWSRIPVLFLSVYILIWCILLILPKFFHVSLVDISIIKHNLFLSTLLAFSTIVLFYTKNKIKYISIGLLLVLVVIDLFYVFNKFTPFSPIQLMYPKTPVVQFLQENQGIYRNWGYGSAYIPANYQTYYGLYSADGYDPLFIKDYAELLSSSNNGTVPSILSRTDANISPGYGPLELSKNIYRQKILNLLGVKYVLNLDEGLTSKKEQTGTFPHETYKLIWQQAPWQIYENKNVLPRFFLTPQVVVIQNSKERIASIYKIDLRKILILSQKPAILTDSTAIGNVTLLRYAPTTVVFHTISTGEQFLFLSDTYYQGWKAEVDGVRVPIYKADYAFRAVEIPKGVHTVAFIYNSPTFKIGILVAIGGVLIFVGGVFYLVKMKYSI